MKKYHLDKNEVAYLHCVNSAFAGLDMALKLLKDNKKVSKKKLASSIENLLHQGNIAICSEYIRGELIKKNVIENDPSLLCTFDPSTDNSNDEAIVYTKDELGKQS